MMQKDATEKLTSTTQSQFVSRDNETNSSTLFDAKMDIDVSFLKQNTWLQHPPVHMHEQALVALSGRISRNPNDLYSLTKRVYLLKALEQKERLLGAIYDLIHCLQHRGESLRLRVLSSVRDLVNPDEYEQLTQAHIRSSTTPYTPQYDYSLFCNGVWGSTHIVNKEQSNTPIAPISSPLEEAKELLNQGEIEAAIRVLKESLQTSPSDQEVSNELYVIYAHMRDFAAIAQLRRFLDANHVPYPKQWVDMETKLRNEATRS